MEVAKWDVKNHGGNPTTNKSKKYAIFVGRFSALSSRSYFINYAKN